MNCDSYSQKMTEELILCASIASQQDSNKLSFSCFLSSSEY